MNTVVFYDDTGRIVKVKHSTKSNIKLATDNTKFNHICFDADDPVDTDGKFVEDGKLVDVPPQPSKWHKFDFTNKTWRINIDFAKQHKFQDIDQARKLYELSSFKWGGYTIPSDESNQRLIHSLSRLAQERDKSAVLWLTDNSGTERRYEADCCIDIGLELCRHVTESHERARALKLQIKAATTHEELEAIAWE